MEEMRLIKVEREMERKARGKFVSRRDGKGEREKGIRWTKWRRGKGRKRLARGNKKLRIEERREGREEPLKKKSDLEIRVMREKTKTKLEEKNVRERNFTWE